LILFNIICLYLHLNSICYKINRQDIIASAMDSNVQLAGGGHR
jgi:hypothetical protein